MKKIFVKNSNWQQFETAVRVLEQRGSNEASIMLLSGEPGTGKTRTVDRFGSDRNGVYLQGMPGMTVAFTSDYLADRLGVNETKSYLKFNEVVKRLRDSGSPIILDEAQHAAEGKAKPLEYLRRVAEQAGVILVMVCHTSEVSRFSERRMAHINTRISAAPIFKPASLEDCARYLDELCEVRVDEGIKAKVYAESGNGRYRLINNAIKSLEQFGVRLNKAELTLADVKSVTLCLDVMAKVGARK